MNPPCAYVPVGEVVTDAVAGADGVCVAVALMVDGVRVALQLRVPLTVRLRVCVTVLLGEAEDDSLLDRLGGGEGGAAAATRRTRWLSLSAISKVPLPSRTRVVGL